MKCPLFNFCKTAICRIKEPDETCYWYKYFKNIIKKNEINEKKIYNNIIFEKGGK